VNGRPVKVDLAGNEAWLRPERALWLPAEATLVVADLHVGKEAAFRDAGLAVPGGILDETLGRLGRACEACRARRIVVAGDLVHSRRGLSEAVVARFAAWRAGVGAAIDLVRGNHDRHAPELPPEWRVGEAGGELRLGPLRIVHEPGDGDDAFTIAGHLHPTVTLRSGVDRLTLPCFALTPRSLVMPAFTRFARGVPVASSPGSRFYAIAGDEVVEVDPERASGRDSGRGSGGGAVCAATIAR
jgi:DNA ligase-associated metallophosphoesterase